MRLPLFAVLAAPLALMLACGGVAAQDLRAQDAAGPVPPRRAVLSQGVDLPGSDIRSIFDTTLEACERACLGTAQCTAFTFNARAGACFPKTAAGSATPFAGAISGRILATDPSVLDQTAERRQELSFLAASDLRQARDQAAALSRGPVTADGSAADLQHALAAARARGDSLQASGFAGALANLTDAPGDWLTYAGLLSDAETTPNADGWTLRQAAFRATINAYLRSPEPGPRVAALRRMAGVLERMGRGHDTIPALRLAARLAPKDSAVAAALDRAEGRFGFRIVDQSVESDSAAPRICATFSDPLIKAGRDYAPYVKLPEQGLSVSAEGQQICIGGLDHGKRYSVTFRQGLPAADGESLRKAVTLTLYVRDRSPQVRFPGKAYVLPRSSTVAIPVQTVNTRTLDLSLRRVSDRNLLRAIQSDYFGHPMSDYDDRQFASDVAEEVWSGTADVGMVLNRDMTTRLPLDSVLKDLPTGIYELRADLPGPQTDPQPASQWFVVSDLGMTAFSGTGGLHLTLRSLATTAPEAGVTVTLLSRANTVLGTATTDAEGNADFPAGLTRGTGAAEPGLVTAEVTGKGGAPADIGFLALTDPPFDLSDRGVTGHEPSPPIDVFLTTDRGAYRAGETVHVTALARDDAAKAIAGLPLTARLQRPDGVEYMRLTAQDAGDGGHVFDLPLDPSAPRGPWHLDLFADVKAPPLASASFLVEDFLPERIDFTLALAGAVLHPGAEARLDIAAKYLFGAPGADLKVEGEMRLSAADRLEGYPGYVFGRYDDAFSSRSQPLPQGAVTDAAGNVSIPAQLPQAEEAGQPLTATAVVRLTDGSGRPVERTTTLPAMPEDPVIGIRPLFDGVVDENGTAAFDLQAVGPDLKPAAMQVHWQLNRVETRYQWYQTDGDWRWTPLTTRSRAAEGDASLTAAGALRIAAPVTYGHYELRVARTDGAYAAASTDFYAGWYAPADGADTPDTLQMSLDKPSYRPGETAMLRVEPRAAGTALVTVLSNRLISRTAVAVTAGDNRIPVPVTKDWGAGAYVTVSVLRPMDEKAGRNPARALGLAYAKVDPGDKLLTARFDAPAEAEPRAPLDVGLKVAGLAPGETAHATIAAVDVGILNLTGFTPPDPADHYFGQRKLGVGIRDLYGRLIDGLNGTMGKVRSGGDAGAPRSAAPPPTEKLVAFFSGVVTVGADGVAHASFDLPAFNGTVRLMAVVWSKTGVGHASADVLVRDPVVVQASLPRFLAPGDKSRLRLDIVHARGPTGEAGLEVTSDGIAIGAVPAEVDLSEGGKKTVLVPISASAAGMQTISVVLTTPGGQRLTKELTLPVEKLDPAVTRASRFTLDPGKSFTFDADVFDGLVPGTASATVAVGPIARFDAAGLLAMLNRYPYGCTEQLASRAMPLLYFPAVESALGLGGTGAVKKRIDDAIRAILTNQSSSGSFGLWRPDSGDLWLDSYVTDFLSRARAAGHGVPEQAFRMALDNLRNAVNAAPELEKDGGPYAYAMMVLAREGAASIGDLRYYADARAGAFDTPIAAAQLGAALAYYGDQGRADAMFTRAMRLLALQKAGGNLFSAYRDDFGTDRRDAAAVLALATEAGSHAIDPAVLTREVTAGDAGTASTQEASWTLLATHALIDRSTTEGFTVNGAPVTGPLVRVIEGQTAGQHTLDIHNGGTTPAALTVTTYGVPEVTPPAGGTAFGIVRHYYTMQGKPADIARVKVGTRLVAVVEVTPFAKGGGRLMVSDPLPAGFEIDNPDLLSGGDTGGLDWLDATTDTADTQFLQDRFLAALDRHDESPFRLAYVMRAVSPGTFHQPAASVEDMYRPANRAHTDAGTVVVTP